MSTSNANDFEFNTYLVLLWNACDTIREMHDEQTRHPQGYVRYFNIFGNMLFRAHRLIDQVSMDIAAGFEITMNEKLDHILPIMSIIIQENENKSYKSYKWAVVLETILFCLGNLSSTFGSEVIPHTLWDNSNLIPQLIQLLHNKQHHKLHRDVHRTLQNLAANSRRDDNLANILKEAKLSHIMYELIMDGIDKNEFVFAYRSILYLDGANTKQIESLIFNADNDSLSRYQLLDWLFTEYGFALMDCGMTQLDMTFYPNCWNRALTVSLLTKNHKFHSLLVDKCHMMHFVSESLTFDKKSDDENIRLWHSCFVALLHLSRNLPRNLNCFQFSLEPLDLVLFDGVNDTDEKCLQFMQRDLFCNIKEKLNAKDKAELGLNKESDYVNTMFKEMQSNGDEMMRNIHMYYAKCLRDNNDIMNLSQDIRQTIVWFIW
eukprot:201846_1